MVLHIQTDTLGRALAFTTPQPVYTLATGASTKARFRQARFRQARFRQARFRQTRFRQTRFRQTRFRQATCDFPRVRHNRLVWNFTRPTRFCREPSAGKENAMGKIGSD